MAFVSILTTKEICGAKLVISKNTAARVTKAVSGNHQTINVEVDFEHHKIRLIVGDNFSKRLTGRVKCCFSVPKTFCQSIIPNGNNKIEIPLIKNIDGWWYGDLPIEGNADAE
ncbi:hypothetical protein [Yersinia enterocolitica]|uniref:hypothetical protein n=1 Tax=Yersinia enterocolitica TaxID=630 RepID=UPI003CFE4BF7